MRLSVKVQYQILKLQIFCLIFTQMLIKNNHFTVECAMHMCLNFQKQLM